MTLTLPPAPEILVPNPGGVLSPDEVVGRDALIERYWSALERRSLALLAPRRMGKTSICRRMVRWPPAGFVTRFRDLEGRTRATDLVQLLFEDVSDLLRRSNALARRARSLLEKLTGTVEIQGFKLNLAEQDWRQLLEAIFADLEQHCAEQGVRIVLFWDEFPLFIRALDRGGHPQEAMAVLDLLRAARQQHEHLRMVLTGSIGLQEVIASLKRQGYGNDPINDVTREIVPPLDPAAGAQLVQALARGAGATVEEATAAEITALCEGYPYLIQHVVHRLGPTGRLSVPAAAGELDRLLGDPGDPMDLHHYLARLGQVYPPEVQALARQVLDRIALSEQGLTTAELIAALPDRDAEGVREVLHALHRDLYLERHGWRYRFSLAFLQRYWKRERGL